MPRTVLAIGTNLGDRENNVREALNRLECAFGAVPTALSPVVNTKAVGFEGPDFLNCLVEFDVDLEPFRLLETCKRIEKDMGRSDSVEYDSAGGRIYHDRVIDIDILTFGNQTVDTPELKIPHPQIKTRSYIKELLLTLHAHSEKKD